MSLEQLWAGWRHGYVTSVTDVERADVEPARTEGECVFCRIAGSGAPAAGNGIVWRDDLVLAVLNAYPYASGHLLVMPGRHVSGLEELTAAESGALWGATQAAVAALSVAYGPDGLNVGANLGRAAGAGIPRHLHLHVLPRFTGDTNFMTSVAGVRVLPEPLPQSWERLHQAWA
ncbi:MAG: HIT family protein [Acidimicrobiales bacterium]